MMFWFWICAIVTRVYVWVVDTPRKTWFVSSLAAALAFVGFIAGHDVLYGSSAGIAVYEFITAKRECDEENDQ